MDAETIGSSLGSNALAVTARTNFWRLSRTASEKVVADGRALRATEFGGGRALRPCTQQRGAA